MGNKIGNNFHLSQRENDQHSIDTVISDYITFFSILPSHDMGFSASFVGRLRLKKLLLIKEKSLLRCRCTAHDNSKKPKLS